MSEESQRFPWPAAAATGTGSMPGTDPVQAMAVILGELPDVPHLPELPGRGAGADMIGRAAAMLVDVPVETTPGGWKLAARPGRDQRRAAGLLSADLDAAQEAAGDWAGPFKVQACGPWTLAAALELPRSQNPALADPGAVADLTASLAEGIAAHVAEIRGRIPGATVLLQLDEPSLPAVLAGSVPTASGLNRVGAVDTAVTSAALRAVLDGAAAFGLVHCCARRVPFRIMKEAGAQAVSFDLSLLRGEEEQDALAEVVEAGLGILAGVIQISERMPAGWPKPRETAQGVLELWHRMGTPARGMDQQVVLTPACGLAGTTEAGARAALAHCREAARLLPELIEEGT
jgi:methionine synthase II (cobalamin-independent)